MKLTAWIEAEVKGEAVMTAEAEPKKTPNGWSICPICGKAVPSEHGLKIHITRVHKKQERAEGD